MAGRVYSLFFSEGQCSEGIETTVHAVAVGGGEGGGHQLGSPRLGGEMAGLSGSCPRPLAGGDGGCVDLKSPLPRPAGRVRRWRCGGKVYSKVVRRMTHLCLMVGVA